MNTLRATIERLRQETLAASGRRFREASERRPALAEHADLSAVLAVLGNESEEAYPAREALTAAMMAEHQETGDPLWASALLVAYYPMLGRLRFRLVSAHVLREELDQVVITAFLAAVNEVPLHLDRMPMRLRQRTERTVFAFLRKEWAEYQPSGDKAELAQFGTLSIVQWRFQETNEFLLDLSMLLARARSEGFSPDSIELIEATMVRRERLRSYVARLVPDDEEERERTYQRLKRQRTRTLQRLRDLLHASPTQADAGF